MKRHSHSNLQVIFLFISASFLTYWLGRSAMWFVCGLMILSGTISGKIEEDDSLSKCLQGFLIALDLALTGGIQIASGMAVKALFFSVSPYTNYHAMIHALWVIIWLMLALLDVISSGGKWNFPRLLKVLLKEASLLSSITALPIAIQVQHQGNL